VITDLLGEKAEGAAIRFGAARLITAFMEGDNENGRARNEHVHNW
jgi:hypothetical protein